MHISYIDFVFRALFQFKIITIKSAKKQGLIHQSHFKNQ